MDMSPSSPLELTTDTSSSSSLEWSLRIRSKEHELGRSYTVMFFLGVVPENVNDWRSADSLLGTHVSFTWTGDVPADQDPEIQSFISLQTALEHISGLSAFTYDLVVPYLQDNLHWRVQKSNGEVVDATHFRSLKISALSMSEGQEAGADVTEYPLRT